MTSNADSHSSAAIAGYYDSGVWLRDSFFDMIERQASDRGSQRFIFDDHVSLTFGEYRDRTVRLAAGLRQLGLQQGDRVVVQLPNWVEFAVTAAAVARAGGVVVPLMPIYRDAEVEFVLRHCGARLAITCDEWKGFSHHSMFARLITTCDDLVHVLVARGDDAGADRNTSPWERHLLDGDIDDLLVALGPDSGPDENFLIVYTSGTTARPKGCLHTVNTVRASPIAIAESLCATGSDVQFGPTPISHSTGLMTSVILPLLVGSQSYLMETWSPDAAVVKVARHKCTTTVTATAFLQMYLRALKSPADAASLRKWVCAGSPIPGAVVEHARPTLPSCQVLSLYGRSESFLNAMCAVDDPPALSTTTDGKPRGGARLRVVDSTGHELPPGSIGDIAYRGPSHMLEYYRDPQQTAALAACDGFSRSGDLGYMTESGYVRVTGRTKDIVILGGLNISARELEDLLIGHPDIDDIAIVGMPDERLGREGLCVRHRVSGQESTNA